MRLIQSTFLALLVASLSPVFGQRASAVYVYSDLARPIAGTSYSVDVVAIDANSNLIGNTNPVWTTTNAAIAEFRDGKVQARNPGMADLAVTILGARGTLRVQVLPARIEISPGTTKVELGQEVEYKATVFNAQGDALPNVVLRWDVQGLDGGTNNGISIPAAGGKVLANAIGRYRVRANIDYSTAQPGQFLPIFTSSVELTIDPKRYFRTNMVLPSQTRVGGFRLTARNSRLSMNASGDLAFLASAEGLGTAVVRAKAKNIELAAITGESIARPGTVVSDFDDVQINNSGEILASAIHQGSEVYSTGRSLYLVTRPGVARGATLAGVISGGADSLTNFRFGQHSYNNQGQYAYTADFFLPGTRTNRNGIFLGDGNFDERIFISTDAIPGLKAPFTFPGQLVVDDQDNIWFVVNDADNRTALCYRGYNDGLVQVIASDFKALNGYKPVQIDSLVGAGSGTVAFRMRDAALGWALTVMPKPDPAFAKTRELSGDHRRIFDVNANGDVLFYGNLGAGAGIYLWPWSGSTRAIALLQRAAPNGEVYADFRYAVMNPKGEIAFAARTDATTYLVVRDRGGQDEVVFPQPNLRFPDPLRLTFPSFITGSRAPSPMVLSGSSQPSLIELGSRGPRLLLTSEMQLPSGEFFSDTNVFASQPDGSLLVSCQAGVFRYGASQIDKLAVGFSNVPGGSQYWPYRLAANTSGSFLSLHNSSFGTNRLNLNSANQTTFLGSFGNPSNAAFRTASPTGGFFQNIGNIDLDDNGIAYVSATTSAGANGLFSFDGGAWQPLVIANQTQIDGNTVRSIGSWDVGGDRLYAAVQFGAGRAAILECQARSCRVRFDNLSDLPTGGTLNGFNQVSANRKNELAFSYNVGSNDVIAFFSPGQPARLVMERIESLPAGEWVVSYPAIRMLDNGHVLVSAFTTNDNFAILDAEPLN